MGVFIEQIGNKKVTVVDCANLGNNHSEEIIRTLREASALVAKEAEKSVYIITDITSSGFNSDIANAFKEYAAANTKYVRESVIVGLTGLQTVIFSAIKALTKREFKLEDTMDGARAYMASI